MRRVTFLGVVLILALSACAPVATATNPPTLSVPVTGATATPQTMTEAPAETATTAATEAPTTATTSATGISINTSTSANVSGPFLVDQAGRSLYIFTDDKQNSGTSACTDAECVSEWPALIVTDTPQAGEGVDATMLGTITLADGTMQATYNGWPLHYFADDTAAGDTKGQGMEGKWFLVSPTGTAIK